MSRGDALKEWKSSLGTRRFQRASLLQAVFDRS